jgi:hypothetical protein
MAISLQEFRNKAQAGGPDAERLEVNSRGDGLHRKGLSRGGKVVEWMRDAVGARKAENKQVMHAFVAALKAEYGDSIGSGLGEQLDETLEGGAKPLSARMVRVVLQEADNQASRDRSRVATATADSFSSPARGGKLSGYMSAAVAAAQATGVGNDLYERLFDDKDVGVAALRQSIRQQIVDAGQGGRVPVTSDAALAIADRAMRKFLAAAANDQTSDAVLGAPFFQKHVAVVAEQLGVPELAAALSDPNSPACQTFKKSLLIGQPQDRPTDPATLKQAAEAKLSKFMARQLVDGGHLEKLTGLPRDPELAQSLGSTAISEVFRDSASPGLEKHQPALARLIHDGIAQLGEGSDAERQVARQLDRELRVAYAKIADPEVRLGILTRERDEALAEARQPGADGSFWQVAAMRQNDIIALHLRGLGEPLTAQSRSRLEKLAQSSPQLAGAMVELDQIERDFVQAMGGDPNRASLSWRERRDELAQIRKQLADLRGLAADSEHAPGADGNEVQAFIAERMRGLTATMFDKAMQVLGPPPGPPPANFAVLSLGSAARGEASPYSDVEFAIVLDRPATPELKGYMQRLSELVRFQVDNLGEGLGLETPAGFHWDPAGNSPVEEPDKFIGSAGELVTANLREAEEGTPTEIFGLTMFSGAEYLYSPNGDADWPLVKGIQTAAARYLDAPSEVETGLTRGQVLGRWMIGEALAIAKLDEAAKADVVDVKALARFPMLLAQGLAREHGIAVDETGSATNSTLMRLDALESAGVLSAKDAQILRDATIALGGARIEAHLQAGWADDRVHLDPANAGDRFAAPELRPVIQSLLPFADRAERHLAVPQQPF